MSVTVEEIPQLLRRAHDERAERAAQHVPEAPSWPALGAALAGTATLGLVAGLGSGDPRVATESVTTLPLTGLGACALTAPALLALIPFFDLRMSPQDAVRAMGQALVRGGRLAWGFVPLMLFAIATTELSQLAFVAIALLTGIAVTRSLHRGLVGAEAAARLDHDEPELPSLERHQSLLIGWCALHAAVALRLLVSHLPA
jgi:hypothetical protein